MYDNVKTDCGGLSIRGYNLAIGLILLYGFVVNILMVRFCTDIFMGWNFTAILIGYFVVAITGVCMSRFSDSAFVSFIGYNFVVVPVGVILSIALTGYDQISIMNALRVTGLVTCTMCILATVKPDFFLSLGKVLLISLAGVIVYELIFLLIGIGTSSLFDWGVALLFCGYIGYDWADAQSKDYTLNNAVDSVVSLYLDIINLFLRILSASSKSSKNSK